MIWMLFSNEKFKSVVNKCSNLSTSELDQISWKYLKAVVKNKKCLNNIINIANTCIILSYQPAHFKELFSIIISKPNKVLYNFSKMFKPIILLNTLGKLIEKILGEHL